MKSEELIVKSEKYKPAVWCRGTVCGNTTKERHHCAREKSEEYKFREIGAITLISLVITVILLIILASIVINLSLGENGIFNKAKYAKKLYENAQERENEELNELYCKLLVASDGTINNISVQTLKELIQKEISNSTGNPIGTVISYMGNNAPNGYLFCDGKEYNILDYKNLAEQIKSEFGSYNFYGGDGITTFAVPDLRGEFLRGTGTNSHTNQGSGATVGTHQDATTNYKMNYGGSGELWLDFQKANDICPFQSNYDSEFDYRTKEKNYRPYYRNSSIDRNYDTAGAAQYTTRPTNTSVLYCIKY